MTKLLFLVVILISFNGLSKSKPNHVSLNHLFEYNYDSELIDELKNSELIFFMKPEQLSLIDQYEAMFEAEWDVCEYRISESYDEFLKELEYPEGKFFMSIMSSESSNKATADQPFELYINYRPYLTIWKPRFDKKGELHISMYSMLCAIPLVYDQKAFNSIKSEFEFIGPENYYEWSRFHNWTPQHIGFFLRVASFNIKNTDYSIELADGRNVNKEAGRLKKANLIIPSFSFDDRFETGSKYYDELESETPLPINEIMSDYTWKYIVLNRQEFEDYKIQKDDYYFFFQRGGINVFSMHTGEVIFHFPFQPTNTWSFELTKSKFDKLVKAINKAK